MKLNRLRGLRTYLIGCMDRVPDGGVGWRRRITPILHELGVVVFDPTDKPIKTGFEDDKARQFIQQYKDNEQYELAADLVKDIRRVDLRMVDISDFTIAHLDLEVYAFGSVEEITLANRQKKPILVWVDQGKQYTPNWLLGMIPHQMIFGSEKELIDYLHYIDSSPKIETFNRWYFFDKDKLLI